MVEFARLAKRKEENKEFVIILVLYDMELVECRDVKKQREWKKKWNKWARSDKRIVIADWTSVLKLFGPILSISRDKVGGAKQLIGEVVAEVCKRVLPETRGDDLDMQGKERICELVCAKRQASEESGGDGPCVVGLYGIGGIGKSTVCKALCEKLRSDFGGRVCHAELATSRDEGKDHGMLGEMVTKLIGTRHEVVSGYNKTKLLNLLLEKLGNQRVFVAIDNVGDGASTKELARMLLKARYAKESFVVVTARTMEMLRDVGVSEGECHEMPGLEYEEAKSVFLNKGPKGLDPEDAFVERCVEMCYFSKGDGERCHYHPLALKVLGGQLGYDPEEWGLRLEGRDRFNALREEWRLRLKERDLFNALREREHTIYIILKHSFDLLKPEDQVLFMDLALLFPENTPDRNRFFKYVKTLTWLRTIHGGNEEELLLRLGTLKKTSLIEYVGDGNYVVGVHDLLRKFCVFEITRGDGRGPSWFCRMDEIHESDEECRFYNGGWEDLQRVCLTVSDHTRNIVMSSSKLNLQGCAKLKVLKLVNVVVENRVVDVSSLLQLRSLEVSSVNVEAPVDLQGLGLLKDLRALIWVGIPSISAGIEEIADLIKLEVLIMSAHEKSALSADRRGIMRIPNLSGLRYLRSVTLRMG